MRARRRLQRRYHYKTELLQKYRDSRRTIIVQNDTQSFEYRAAWDFLPRHRWPFQRISS